jgi:hypothetical protein
MPSTSTSNRERILVSRTNRPWADPGEMSPAPPLMAKVDSSTSVTTLEEPNWVTGPAKFHGSAMGGTVPADLVTCAILRDRDRPRRFPLFP